MNNIFHKYGLSSSSYVIEYCCASVGRCHVTVVTKNIVARYCTIQYVICKCCDHTGETCSNPPHNVQHGKVLFNDKKKYFYYEDQVEILCELGYVINDGLSSNNNSKKITCTSSNHTWDLDFFNCTGRVTFICIICIHCPCTRKRTCIYK